MRVIGTLSHENHARRFSKYLEGQGISNTCEVSFEPTSGEMSYTLWIHDEDKLADASAEFKEFQTQPMDPKFDPPIVQVPEPVVSPDEEEMPIDQPPPHRFKTRLTNFLVALCCFVYFLNTLQEIPLRREGLSEKMALLTPLQARLMYDLPPAYEKLQQVVEREQLTNEKVKDISPEVKAEIEVANNSSYWRGIYDWVVHKVKGEDTSQGEGPLFSKIRQGEVWRLISPVVLHSDLLHILFNMLWLWFLGRPVEQRIGPFRTLLLSLVVGVGSNTIQYFMSGPFFIGYSGIVTGLAGFIWMRERVAPWEGYPLNKATILFLLFFIAAIFVLQIVAFAIQIFTVHNFAPNIANTAHIVGAVIGALLGRYHFFAQRVHK